MPARRAFLRDEEGIREHSRTLGHLGVLFPDELSLYRKDALESLRAPLEDGVVRLARSGGVIAFPCRFSLVGAMNPCPCGYLGDARRACRCTRHQLELHRARLSGPLLERIDKQFQKPGSGCPAAFSQAARPDGLSDPFPRRGSSRRGGRIFRPPRASL